MTDARLIQASRVREGRQGDPYQELGFSLGYFSAAQRAGSTAHSSYGLPERRVILQFCQSGHRTLPERMVLNTAGANDAVSTR